MYQLEVKYNLVKHMFSPQQGWEVLVDIDAMERAKGSQHTPDKKAKVQKAEDSLVRLGASVGAHKTCGRVDVFASHKEHGIYLVEVEGQSSKQKEQAMYSAIGQVVLMMNSSSKKINYAIAVPFSLEWERQINKIPERVKNILNLHCLLVSEHRVKSL
jgi:hypothetical protein